LSYTRTGHNTNFSNALVNSLDPPPM